MRRFKKQLISLLQIQASSGNEKPVVEFCQPILEELCDKVFTDSYGNLLGEKLCGNGNGATILLSAHMDSVKGIVKGRKIVEVIEGIVSSTAGILGADDRAGIAIILTVLRNVSKSGFNGIIKVAFTKEEEVGCVGAGQIDEEWLRGTNLAIVVDRRGNRDIVINCGGYQPFCDEKVGEFFEEVGAMANMTDWKAVNGGVSDATVFSAYNINSVNLSAGYYNEHSDKEYVNINYCKDTIKLILQAFAVVDTFYQAWSDVPASIPWGSWSTKKYTKKNTKPINLANVDDDIFFETNARFGSVSACNVGGYISIMQETEEEGTQEVLVSVDEFEAMVEAYNRQKYGRFFEDQRSLFDHRMYK